VVPLGALGLGLLAVIGEFPDREVTADLGRLQRLLEADDGDETRPAARPPESGPREAADDEQRGTR
jgi:hypothetical protein